MTLCTREKMALLQAPDFPVFSMDTRCRETGTSPLFHTSASAFPSRPNQTRDDPGQGCSDTKGIETILKLFFFFFLRKPEDIAKI